MPLLEKAFAKIHMNYDRLSSGAGIEGLRALTGMPVRFYFNSIEKKDVLKPKQ